jgi:hypothetical protein
MAVSIWLQRSDTAWLDLDTILSVELPAAATPRILEQIISTEYIAVPPSEKITAATVGSRSGVTWLTPMLRRTVGDFFGSPKTFAGYLCAARKAQRQPCSDAEAKSLFEERRDQPIRSMLRSSADLLALLEFLSPRIDYPLPPEAGTLRAEELADRERFERLRAELAAVKTRIAAAAEAPEDLAAAQKQKELIEEEMAVIMKLYHDGTARPPAWKTKSTIHVNGGISLRPGEFTIRTSASSPALRQFKQLAKGAAVEARVGQGAKRLVRSRPAATRPAVAAATKAVPPASGSGAGAPPGKAAPRTPVAPRGSAGAAAASAQRTAPKTTAPKAAPPPSASVTPARAPTPVAKNVSIPAGAAGAARVVGELAADGRIVFRKASP